FHHCFFIFETRTVGVGGDVRLTCTRKSTGSLFWIRLVSGEFPKVLGKTFSFESDPRITATEEPGTFVLHIAKARLRDTAVYYCMQIHQQNFTFLKGADLRVEGPEPDPTAVPPSDPCSVLSDSENKTCPEEQSVFCFRAGSHQCGPGFNYTQGNSVEEHEKNPEGLSTKKCIYSFSKNVSCSDGGTYYCAMVTCGEIFSGNGSKLKTEGNCIVFICNKIIRICVCLIKMRTWFILHQSLPVGKLAKEGQGMQKQRTKRVSTLTSGLRGWINTKH
uniref:Ig-like domain-containing protein n=1 Tax=Sander lucioperca TaxID=283035 RepID=A0A8D0AL95_SANLU